MRISYAITVCNEFLEIQRLLNFLIEHKREEDEIVILWLEDFILNCVDLLRLKLAEMK